MRKIKQTFALLLVITLLLGFASPLGDICDFLLIKSAAYGSNDIDPNFIPQWPVKGQTEINAVDYYQTWKENGSPKYHNGLDIQCSGDVYPVATGEVIYAGGKKGVSYGYNVVIKHTVNGKVFCSRYAHLAPGSIKVTKGTVEPTTVIGTVGGTGSNLNNADWGKHLHLEIYRSDGSAEPSAWWNNKDTRYDILNSTLFYYINNNPSQLVNVKISNDPLKSNYGKNVSKYSNFFRTCYKKSGYKYAFDPLAYIEYKRVTPVSPAVKMRVNKDKAAHRTGPYEKCTVVEELKLNQEVTVVGYCINIYGNLWYKTDKGYWVYGERLSNEQVGRINFSAKKSSNIKTNKKSQITTVPAPIVATAYGKTVIPGPAPKLDGYTFLGYSTKENALEPEYLIGQEIDVSPNDLNLYCVWKQEKVTMELTSNKVNLDLTNNSNVGVCVKATVEGNLKNSKRIVEVFSDQSTIATVSTSNNNYNGNLFTHLIKKDVIKADVNITGKAPGRANIIVSVKDNAGTALAQQTIVVDVDERYTVSFYDGDTNFNKSQTKHFNKGLTLSEFVPEKDDHIRFLGWSTSKDSSIVAYGPGDVYSENHSLDLYAVWVKDPFIEHSYLNGVLTITGRGNMPSYPTGKAPWANYKDLASKIIISSEITTIGSNAFNGFKNVTEVEIPDTVWYIGSNAFNSTLIKQVRIPSRGVKIGNRAFANCTKLIDVAFADAYSKNRSKSSAADQQIEIGAFAFENCVSLASIDLPNTVTELGAGAFNGCSNLESVDLSENLTNVEDSVFFGCNSLTNIEIPDGVKSIGDGSFDGCSALPKVELPDGLAELGDRAFAGCSAIDAIELPDGIKDYGAGVFSNCSALETVDLPEGMTQVPDAMFSGCSALETVDLPDSVEVIGDGAFRSCSALKPIKFSDNVTKISNSAFWGCNAFESVVIPASVTEVGDFAFCDCDNLKKITLNEGLTTISTAAFAFCDSLESAAIPASVTLLDDGAFMGCSALEEVELLESPITIGDDVFFDCSSLTGIQLPESIVSLGENVFGGCANSFTVSCFSTASIYDQVVDTCANVDTIYPATGVSLSKTTAAMHAGQTLQLQAIVAPVTATDKAVVWTTNHPEIATVDENGLVTTIKGGTVVITATTNDNKLVAQCEITVTVPVTGIELSYNETTAYVDDSFDMGYFFAPTNPTNIGVSWSTSDNKVATVSENGEVTIVGVGNATITVTTEDGEYTASCAITAERYINVEEIVLEKNEITLRVGNSAKLNASVLPANATDPYVSYVITEDTEGIIEFEEDGTITALKPGTVEITVTAGGVQEKTCTVTVLPKAYAVTWNVDGAETKVEYEPGATIKKPADPVKTGYTFKGWTPAVPATMPAEDLTFTAVFEKNADEESAVNIRNFTANKTVDYKATVTFTAEVKNAVSGATVHWFIDGKDAGTGDTYTVSKAKKSYTVQVKYIKDGKVLAESGVEKVNVKTGLFAKLSAFFRFIFGKLPKVVQGYLGAEIIERFIP